MVAVRAPISDGSTCRGQQKYTKLFLWFLLSLFSRKTGFWLSGRFLCSLFLVSMCSGLCTLAQRIFELIIWTEFRGCKAVLKVQQPYLIEHNLPARWLWWWILQYLFLPFTLSAMRIQAIVLKWRLLSVRSVNFVYNHSYSVISVPSNSSEVIIWKLHSYCTS